MKQFWTYHMYQLDMLQMVIYSNSLMILHVVKLLEYTTIYYMCQSFLKSFIYYFFFLFFFKFNTHLEWCCNTVTYRLLVLSMS